MPKAKGQPAFPPNVNIPKIDPKTGSLTVSVVNEKVITEDWDFRNYSDDWLPVMFTPGGGTFPKVVGARESVSSDRTAVSNTSILRK